MHAFTRCLPREIASPLAHLPQMLADLEENSSLSVPADDARGEQESPASREEMREAGALEVEVL